MILGHFFLILISILFVGPYFLLLSQTDFNLLPSMLQTPSLQKSIQVTLTSSIAGSFISVLVGAVLSQPFSKLSWRGKRLERLTLLLPYLVPNFILATAYVIAWNPSSGLLNPVFHFPFGLYGTSGMTILFGIAHAPIAFLMLEEKMKRMDSSLREAALMSGATPYQIFFKIELPLLKPTLISTFAICFALSLSSFAIPAWIGAPAKSYPLTFKIFQSLQLGGSEGMSIASSLSFLLLNLTLPVLFIQSWSTRSANKYILLSGKGARVSTTTASTQGLLFFRILFWTFQISTWIAPLFLLFLSTLVKPGCLQTQGFSCLSEISFQSYSYVLFDLPDAREALRGSFIYGSISALLIVMISLLSVIAYSNQHRKLSYLNWIYALPVSTPGAILAIALIVACSGQFGINLYNTPWIAVYAYVQKHLNLAFQPLRTGFSNISPTLIEAAQLCGANRTSLWSRILIPILTPELLGGFFLVLIPILGELTMSVFLTSPSFRSIGTVLFDLQDYADQSSAAALSVLLILLILILNELTRILSKGRLGY